MVLNIVLGSFAILSLALVLWQWMVAVRFPLHRRVADASFRPGVTLLKPLKGCDETSEACLRSWLTQEYSGPVQVLFAVASADDPVCELVRKLLAQHPTVNARLIVCGPLAGANAKISKLIELEPLAEHDILVISDADVQVPPDLLANLVAPLSESSVGLVNCFYFLGSACTAAMRWEAVAVNADFWSQVLQSNSLKPMNFALGAVMATRLTRLADIGGFSALADCLADDYQLGHRIAAQGHRIALCPVAVECCSPKMGWHAVWKHQLRWARTVRVCQPAPYFFSLLGNGTLWPLVWLLTNPKPGVLAIVSGCVLARILTAIHLERRLTRAPVRWDGIWFTPIKDLLQTIIWLLAFAGDRVEWRGERMRLKRDGTLVRA